MRDSDFDDYNAGGSAGNRQQSDLGLALIVGCSRVNIVVVSRIAERVGLRCEACAPEEAAAKLGALAPGFVVLDGGPADEDCRSLYAELAARRRASAKHLPAVVLLSTTARDPQMPETCGAVDAVVAKPITPDNLQPLLHKLVEMARR